MDSNAFLKPVTPIEKVTSDTPRTSLDFIIRAPGQTLDDKSVRIQSFNGQESISQPYEYHVDLRADDVLKGEPSDAQIMFSKLIGASATVRIGLPTANDQPAQPYPNPDYVAFFNGIITNFSFKESGVYDCVIRPGLWRLSLVNDYKFYRQMTIKQVIEQVVNKKWGLKCRTDDLTGPAVYRTQDWLQSGETDLDFVTRLLTRTEGFYYFVHDDTSHTVVFANKPAYAAIPPRGNYQFGGTEFTPLYYTFTKEQSVGFDDRILSFSYEQSLVAQNSLNILAQPQAAWEQENVASLTVETDGETGRETFQRYRVYQYGVTGEEASGLNEINQATLDSSAYRLSGQATCERLKPGHVFKTVQAFQGSDRDDVALMRPDLNDRRFVVVQTQHQATVQGDYQNSFTAAAAEGYAQEFNPNHNHQGGIYGTVVSESDAVEATHLHNQLERDNFQLDTNQFYWDEQNPYAAKGVFVRFDGLDVGEDVVWVKVSQRMQTIPEEGVTVIVGRSNDDTEIPEVQDMVEAKGSNTILPPDQTMQNTRVGNDYSTSYGDSRSISYGKNSTPNLDEAIGIVDQHYNSGKKFKSVSYSIGGSYGYSAADEKENGILSQSLSYGKSISESHGDTDSKFYGNSKSYSESDTVESTSKIGTQTSDANTGISNSTTATGMANSASVTGMVNSASLTGVSSSISATGLQNAVDATGMRNNVSATGMVNNASATGMTNSASIEGMSNSLSYTATQNRMSITNASNDISVVTGAALNISFVGGGFKGDFGPGQAKLDSFNVDAHLGNLSAKILSALDVTL